MSDTPQETPQEPQPAPAEGEQPCTDTAPPSVPWAIDMGSFKCCVAAVLDRQAHIVLDEEFSRAEVPSFVSYQQDPSRRFVGESAAGRVGAHFGSTFVELPSLFLEGAEDAYPKCRHTVDERGFSVGEQSFSPSQIAAALFTKLKAQMALKHPEVGQCAIGISGEFNQAQRQAVLDAAAIAEIEVSRLVTSDVAAVHAYCDRHPDANETVLIVDIGHNFCSASISEHREGKAKILAAATVPVGASCVDKALFGLVAQKCSEDHSLDVTIASKIGQRILKQCQATKKILSGIAQSVVHVELDERDLSFNVSRAELTALCTSQVAPVTEMLESLFAELPADQSVDVVEVIGGGSCIPMFQDRIQECLNKNSERVQDKTLRKTLDLSTACTYGAALSAVADSGVTELVPWDAGLAEAQRLGEEELRRCLELEKETQAAEAQFVAHEAARNKFESMIYEMRGLSEGKYKAELPSEKLSPILEREEDWLWGEGESADLEGLQARLAQVETELRAEFESYYQRLEQEATEEKERQEKAAIEFAAHQAAERAELEASGVVRDTRKMPFEERMKMVIKNKDEGTELFKGSNWEPAAVRYTKALNHAELIKDPSDEEREEVRKVRLSLYLNLGMVFSKMKKWTKAIDNCRYALEIDPTNPKALFRRATAYYEERDFDKALQDLETASSGDAPADPAVTKLLKIVQKAIAKREAKEKATYGKMFG